MMMQSSWKLIGVVIGMMFCPTTLYAQANEPVKVYIMAGQSNMVGFGQVGGAATQGTLEYLTNNGQYSHMGTAGNWTVRNDVWYTGVISATANQWLTVGGGKDSNSIGPELQFGHVVGDYHDEPVLLIKASQGNRSLGWDFLPPGSEQYTSGSNTYAGYGDSPSKWPTGTTPTPVNWYAGKQYDDAVSESKQVLAEFNTRFPQWAERGYEIAGFVWWQGHKDSQDSVYASRYEQNMVNFIKEFRNAFDAPEAPFVLSTIGFQGYSMTGNYLTVANAQLAVDGDTGNYPEFAGNVKTTEARDDWRDASVSPGTQDFHYYWNAGTYMDVGDDLGQAMTDLYVYRPFLEVNRQTGQMKIINPSYGGVAQWDLAGYEISSAAGALVNGNWTAIAQNYDADNGGAVDGDDLWNITNAAAYALGETVEVGGDGALVATSTEIDLGSGSWLQNPDEDIEFTYTDANGVVHKLAVHYTGALVGLADYDTDGAVDADDWATFIAGAQMNMSALSAAQAYRVGDLDGDGDNDIYDFDLFRDAYEADNPGPMAFEAMLEEFFAAPVPEPGSAMLLAIGAIGLSVRRRRSAKRANKQTSSRNCSAALALLIGMLAFAGAAQAQTTLFTENFESPDVPGYSQGTKPSNWVGASVGFGASSHGLTDKAGGDFSATDPNHQAYAFRYTNSGLTTAQGVIGRLWFGESYDVSFDVVRDDGLNAGTAYTAQLIAFAPSADRTNINIIPPGSLLLAATSGNATANGLFSTISFDYTQGDLADDAYLEYDLGIRFKGATTSAIIDNVQLDRTEAPATAFVSLQVDTSSGATSLVGGSITAVNTINYYQITSAGNSLNPAGWSSLQDQDDSAGGFPAGDGYGNGWEETGGSGSHSLAEAYLLGDSLVGSGTTVSLGNAYDPTVDARDLALTYRSASGLIFEGSVEYLTSPLLLGDFDGDADVDNADVLLVISNFTGAGGSTTKTYAEGDLDGDGDVDNGDVISIISAFTGSAAKLAKFEDAAGALVIPEPTSLALLGMGRLLMMRRRH